MDLGIAHPVREDARSGDQAAAPRWVLALCFATIVFDGYDLIGYGSVVSNLLAYKAWGLTPQQVGTIGSAALTGMLLGALTVAYLTDLFGRRKVLIACLTWFSLAMGSVLSPQAPAPSPPFASWPGSASEGSCRRR